VKKTSWGQASQWYDKIVGEKGHFYHRELIIPNLLELLDLRPSDSLLDLACGQGVFSRAIPEKVSYTGLEISGALLEQAKSYSKNKKQAFIQADLTQPWPEFLQAYTHAVCILALQNIEKPELVFSQLSQHMPDRGTFIVVLNHPCFRIPRQSRWHVDRESKTQFREMSSYMSAQKIPIVTHPGKNQQTTWSFHLPLSAYTTMASKHGFYVETIHEWCSPKKSTGGAAKWENRARNEFPLFMALVFRKMVV